jgi:hypothetical protein
MFANRFKILKIARLKATIFQIWGLKPSTKTSQHWEKEYIISLNCPFYSKTKKLNNSIIKKSLGMANNAYFNLFCLTAPTGRFYSGPPPPHWNPFSTQQVVNAELSWATPSVKFGISPMLMVNLNGHLHF